MWLLVSFPEPWCPQTHGSASTPFPRGAQPRPGSFTRWLLGRSHVAPQRGFLGLRLAGGHGQPSQRPSQVPPDHLATTLGCTKLALPFCSKAMLWGPGQSCPQGAEGPGRACVHSLQDPEPAGRCHQRLVVKPSLGPESYLNVPPPSVLWS